MKRELPILHLGVHDLAVRAGAAADFLRAERLLVPVDGLRRVVQRQLRRDGVESLRNGLSLLSPSEPPSHVTNV